METREWSGVIDRRDWPAGPWDGEPDKVQFADSATGFPTVIRRNALGNLCGYVGVPPGHPMHGQGVGDVEAEVHGGVTYASPCEVGPESSAVCHTPAPGEPDDVWWIGFDCAHAFDIVPGMIAVRRQVGLDGEGNDFGAAFGIPTVYRDLAYVRQECAGLALQLAGEP